LPQHQTFPKSEHLRYGYQFRRVYDNGCKFVGRLLVLYALNPEPGPSPAKALRAVGFVSSRRVGGAVVRNRARRLLRETYRRYRQRLPSDVQMVLVARPAIADKKQAEVEAELQTLWKRAGLLP
jgi:ribonuclease P protein component